MSLIYRYKPDKDRAILPLASILIAAGITPNLVTITGLIISMIAGVFAASGQLYIGIVLFFVGACLDALDGSLARASGRCTEFGRYLDSVCDRLSELTFIAGAVIGGSPISGLFVVAGSLALLLARVHVHRKDLRSDVARFSRPERLALIIIGLLAPYPFNVMVFLAAGILSFISALKVLSTLRGAVTVARTVEPLTSH
jgi:phosphatidylglycerophosphate synthase